MQTYTRFIFFGFLLQTSLCILPSNNPTTSNRTQAHAIIKDPLSSDIVANTVLAVVRCIPHGVCKLVDATMPRYTNSVYAIPFKNHKNCNVINISQEIPNSRKRKNRTLTGWPYHKK